MPKLSERGAAHLLVPLILLIGIIAGVYLVVTGNLKLFSKASQTTSNDFDARAILSNPDGSLTEYIAARGKYWSWTKPANSNVFTPASNNGVYLESADSRYANGPCLGQAPGTCKFDALNIFKESTGLTELVNAYGKYWSWTKLTGSETWTPYFDGEDLAAMHQLNSDSGPCAGRSTCVLDTDDIFNNPDGSMTESITAYGKFWNWNSPDIMINMAPWPSGNGSDLSTVDRYRTGGPCVGHSPCVFNTRNVFYNPDGSMTESITAYGKFWNWNKPANSNTFTPWPSNGSSLTTVDRYAQIFPISSNSPSPTVTSSCNSSGTGVTFSWNTVPGAHSYNIRVDDKASNSPDSWIDQKDFITGILASNCSGSTCTFTTGTNQSGNYLRFCPAGHSGRCVNDPADYNVSSSSITPGDSYSWSISSTVQNGNIYSETEPSRRSSGTFTCSPATTTSCTEAHPSAATTTATGGTFRVYATGVQNATDVKFPTWSEVNGQDDLIWYPGTNAGGGTWYADIDLSQHPGLGWIRVHTYLFNSGTGVVNQFCHTADFQRTAPTTSPSPVTYGCTANYTLDPVSPSSNSTVTINVSSSNSSNYGCVVLYQDNQPVSCKVVSGNGVGNYSCTANSGTGSSNHVLQLKFGQSNRYSNGTNCGQPVECAPITYQTSP